MITLNTPEVGILVKWRVFGVGGLWCKRNPKVVHLKRTCVCKSSKVYGYFI